LKNKGRIHNPKDSFRNYRSGEAAGCGLIV
jgi:hypothetical protein